MKYELVYQCGIANVIRITRVQGQRAVIATRVVQASYFTCEWYVRGLLEAGAEVSVWHSDTAGDVLSLRDGSKWREGPGDLWRDRKSPPSLCQHANA